MNEIVKAKLSMYNLRFYFYLWLQALCREFVVVCGSNRVGSVSGWLFGYALGQSHQCRT